jgi:hypothetical protein
MMRFHEFCPQELTQCQNPQPMHKSCRTVINSFIAASAEKGPFSWLLSRWQNMPNTQRVIRYMKIKVNERTFLTHFRC